MITPVESPAELKMWYIVPIPPEGATYNGVVAEGDAYARAIQVATLAGHPGEVQPRVNRDTTKVIIEPNCSGSPDPETLAAFIATHADGSIEFETTDAIRVYLKGSDEWKSEEVTDGEH